MKSRLSTILDNAEQRSLFPFTEVEIALLDDDGELTSCSARSYDIHEMLGTKMRALMQRTQGRDLFDLYHAANFGPRATQARPKIAPPSQSACLAEQQVFFDGSL